jgi:SAM-dependent methyltransferase
VHHSYDPAYFAPLFAVEDRHFWFRARNRVISVLVGEIVADLASDYRVLEVGCGTGNVLRVLESVCVDGVVIGMDLFSQGLQYASQRTSCPLVQGNMHSPPFGAKFDLIGLFDVLEHLSDDERVLLDLHTMLAPGGILLLTVPAHSSLWSYFDEASHHRRRYEPDELESRLFHAGYQVEYLTQYMAGIFPLVWLGRRLARWIGLRTADNRDRTNELARRELRVTPLANDLLDFLLGLEVPFIARHRRIPMGTALLAVARKDSSPVVQIS